MRLLIVEDHLEDLEILQIILTRFDCTSVGVTDVKLAMHALEGNDFDLILCDICLPGLFPTSGVSATEGVMFIHWLNREYPHIPVVAMTALLKAEAKEATKDLKLAGVLHKPFSVAELGECACRFKNEIKARGALVA